MEIQQYEELENKIIKKISKKYNIVSYLKVVRHIIYTAVLETEKTK